MNPHIMPIKQVRPDVGDAVRMSVAEIERFLAMFHPASAIREHRSAHAIAGQWLSRVKGFHDDDDFLHLVRDVLAWLKSGGRRSLATDHLSLFFSGFMPSYGTAREFVERVNDGAAWPEVRAFMHSQAYGNAKRYVETFDWSSGEQKAQAEAGAWLKAISEEDGKLKAAGTLAFVAPKTAPWLKPVVGDAVATEVAGEGLTSILEKIPKANPWLMGIVLLFHSSSLNAGEDEALAKIRAQERQRKKLVIAEPQVQADAVVDATNTECRAQIEKNQKNGAKCEEDGYVLMEQALLYQRLVNPPKGRGLDGLFEKQGGTLSAPATMPRFVTQPPPGGELMFIPEAMKPPRPQFNYTDPASVAVYPRFVVFEAKHISKSFGAMDAERIGREAKRRLGKTCDGTQMSLPWTVDRIAHALNRNVNDGGVTLEESKDKYREIMESRYARWIFLCLPGPAGEDSKLFVLIDIVASGMNIERIASPVSSLSGNNTI